MEIEYCIHTGLLYVGNVAFTKEMVERTKKIIEAQTDQFEYNVVIYDNYNQSQLTVDAELLEEIEDEINKHPNGIASDEDFN